MFFNSVEFALFLPVVFGIFWLIERRSFRAGNLWLLGTSMFFYGWWDWRYLALVLLSAGLDYAVALALPKTSKRGLLLAVSLVGNLGLLGFFKYHDFFVTSFAEAFTLFGMPMEGRTLNLVLPVGISFYTFQSMSYTIDVYRRQMEPTRDPVAFGAYVLFFPQLVAGPIERATQLIPQFLRLRRFEPALAADGLRQMLWGLFKKVAVADQCAPVVDSVFGDGDGMPASALLVGAVLFAIQIYCDFSGYSDIAIGCARLFGFTLMRNFAFPYFSRDIAEFWRRWHISLNTWFRDYLYIPLGGSKGSASLKVRNILLVFLISGFWHGANWTFIAWGAINALFFLPVLLSGRNRANLGTVAEGRLLPSPREFLGMAGTFGIAVLAFIFFRSDSVTDAVDFIARMASATLIAPSGLLTPLLVVPLVVLFAAEWLQRERQHALAVEHLPRAARWSIYLPLALCVSLMSGEAVTFIYFQF
jgi:D-alanyl-lipoteichoic acid acyltransferase DltB (MBOAT superfamily)